MDEKILSREVLQRLKKKIENCNIAISSNNFLSILLVEK